MSILENEETFRRKSELNTSLDTHVGSSHEFMLITDHQTSKLKQLENADKPKNHFKSYVRSIFTKKTLYRRLPIMQWLPKYTREDAICDLIAGFTVGLTVIPQGLAYSGVAGLPTEYGLYGSFMGCFVYVLFGTCKDSTVGSTAIASLLVYQFAKGVWQRAVLLTFLTGLLEILMALLRIGFIVEFVSGPVSAGFTSAVTAIIFTSQIRLVLGVKSEGTTFLERWISMIKDIHNIRWADTMLGTGCVAILLILRYVGRIKIGPKDEKNRRWYHSFINKTIWFIGVTRNATIVIGWAAISYYLENQGLHYFKLTGPIPGGLPTIALPPFAIESVPANLTAGIEEKAAESFIDIVQGIGAGFIIIPMIALLENISVCKAFAKNKPIDASQEILCMGVANVANSFFSGYRANGGLARSAVNNASGVRTPLSNLWIGAIVVFALLFLTDFFYYIPKAVLASIILAAVIFQLQYQVIKPMWRSKRTDLIPGFMAFIMCLLLPLEVGVLIAIGLNLMFILYHSARPKVSLETLETQEGQRFLKLTPDRCLIFPSVEFVRNIIIKSGTKSSLPLVIDCTYIYAADYTAAQVIATLVQDYKKRQQKIIFFNLKPSVAQIFEGLKTQLVLCYNIDSLVHELKRDETSELAKSKDLEEGSVDTISKSIADKDTFDINSTTSTLSLTK